MAAERRLMAIMFSDIAGYTEMMEDDEVRGRELALRFRNSLKELAEANGGEVVQNYGDGSLSAFSSAVRAVECAMALQKELRQAPYVPLRIGIHLGDIAIDDDDIYGSGINVASRIESMAVPGSVLVSKPVQTQLSNHDFVELTTLGSFEFKNVNEALEVFAVSNVDFPVPSAMDLTGKFKRPAVKRGTSLTLIAILVLAVAVAAGVVQQITSGPTIDSLAVLPLTASMEIQEDQFITEGIHSGLISALGKLADIKVISQPSTLGFQLGTDSLDVIARALGVEGILTGELSSHGGIVDLDLRLLNVKSPRHKEIWREAYTGDLSQVVGIYDSVKTDVADRIKAQVTQQVTTTGSSNIDPETYKAYLRGMHFINRSTPEDLDRGIQYLKDAIAADPADPWAYVGLAQGYAWLGHGPDPQEQIWRLGQAAATRALSIDSTIAEAHMILAFIDLYYHWDFASAERGFQRALKINPNLAFAQFQYAWYLAVMGRNEEAVKHHLKAKELDPLLPIYTYDMGSLYYWIGQSDLALKEIDEGKELDPEFAHGLFVEGMVLRSMGKYDEAIAAHKRASELHPMWTGILGSTYAMAGQTSRAIEILNTLKNHEITPRAAFWIAFIHLSLGDYDKTFEWMEYRPADPWLVSLRTWPEFSVLHDDPRFAEFLVNVGLPPLDHIIPRELGD